jgi:hypothetical protein
MPIVKPACSKSSTHWPSKGATPAEKLEPGYRRVTKTWVIGSLELLFFYSLVESLTPIQRCRRMPRISSCEESKHVHRKSEFLGAPEKNQTYPTLLGGSVFTAVIFE